ncbi:unnamed protein product [Pieris macdunnoughi]|uniref:Cytochrome b5 heme-binding domain-containing protein n=1 Tax=Pieris macdunnoughi TaxID=345717 RepID=A0A821XTU9_9NEOP|nr:unnamed protein product [Pieris macdunnoughi]
MSSEKQFTRNEVSRRNNKSDLLIIIDNRVYDLTKFQDDHPGGHEVFLQVAGQEASEMFHDVGHSLDAKELMVKYCLGEVVAADRIEPETPQRSWSETDPPTTLSSDSGSAAWHLPVVLGVLATLLYYLLF